MREAAGGHSPATAKPSCYVHTYTYEFLVLFRSYLSVRAPFAQVPRRSTEEGRPDTAAEVSGILPSKFGRVCRVSRVHVPRAYIRGYFCS